MGYRTCIDHPPQGIVFDGDDTLWRTEELYNEARSAARSLVAYYGLDEESWEQLERATDLANVSVLGHTRERFPASCVSAYRQLSRRNGERPSPELARRIRHAAESVFVRNSQLLPTARDTLEQLRSVGIRLAILTKGDQEVQERRLSESGLRELFDVISIVDQKSTANIRALIARLGTDAEVTWMVGNSIRSDILPAMEAGLRAVWIDADVWDYERVDGHVSSDMLTRALDLCEIPDLISL